MRYPIELSCIRSAGVALIGSMVTAALLLSAGCASAPKAVEASGRTPVKEALEGSADPADPSSLAKTFEQAVGRGDAAWRTGDGDMAIYQYVQALSFKPRDVTTLCKIGTIELSRDDLTLAARAFELAASADPHDARVTARLGLILLALGQNEDARTWLERSAKAHSADWHVYDGLGVAQRRLGDNASALMYLRQAAAMAPDEPAPLVHSGEVMLSAGDYDGAETAARAALKQGDVAEAKRMLGDVQVKRRQYTDSIDNLLQVMDASAAYSTVARAALENGDNDVALQMFEKASAASPTYAPELQRGASIAKERLAASHR